MGITYLKISIDDKAHVPIKLSFPDVYKFIEGAFRTMLSKKGICNDFDNKHYEGAVSVKGMSLAPLQVDFREGTSSRI